MHCALYDAGRCRSCQWLERPVPQQLADKMADLRAFLADAPVAEWCAPACGPESGFRNKAKMVVSGSVERPLLGMLHRDGTPVDLTDCPLYPAEFAPVFAVLKPFIARAGLTPYNVARKRGELKYLLLTASQQGEMMLRFVLRSREPLERLQRQLPALQQALPALRVVSVNLLSEHKAVTEGDTEILLTAESEVRCRLNDVDFRLTPRSFLQTNSAIAAALYRQAREWIDAAAPASVWDLYCGVGGFALHAARAGRTVVGIESTPEAIAAARAAGPGGQWIAADATAWARAQQQAADCVIVNPPRRGIGAELAGWLNASGAGTLIYCSCNIESLRRDLAALPAYRLEHAQVFDMFPHSTHYETLVLLTRRLP